MGSTLVLNIFMQNSLKVLYQLIKFPILCYFLQLPPCIFNLHLESTRYLAQWHLYVLVIPLTEMGELLVQGFDLTLKFSFPVFQTIKQLLQRSLQSVDLLPVRFLPGFIQSFQLIETQKNSLPLVLQFLDPRTQLLCFLLMLLAALFPLPLQLSYFFSLLVLPFLLHQLP